MRRTTRQPSRSPGHTPKSSIHRNLARIGTLNSPGGEEEPTALQDFVEKLADGKSMGMNEKQVRDYLANKHVMTTEDMLRRLISEAEVEQARGQRGLTKFLVRWRDELRACERLHSRGESDWSVISRQPTPGTSPETLSSSVMERPPGLTEAPPKVEAQPGVGLKIAAPSVYRSDRKAGAGEAERVEPMAKIAQAIQRQTTKLATLVRNQADTTSHPSGSLKGLGRAAEEVVYVLRACGQYQVGLGAGEHGQALANALLAAQVGASSKLRASGFRQKMTQRLAVGLAGGFWGTRERHCLGAAEFITYTDAELDAFSSEARNSKGGGDQRPAQPQRLDEWLVRVKRQTDVWCLIYGAEWRQVRANGAVGGVAPCSAT